MFVLQLNDMRMANVENLTAVARAETQEGLQEFMDTEKVESYSDDRWNKAYRQGGPLEWYNPPWSCDPSIVNVGSADEWAANARMNFEDQVMILPCA